MQASELEVADEVATDSEIKDDEEKLGALLAADTGKNLLKVTEVPSKKLDEEGFRDELSALSNESLISDEVISVDNTLEERDSELEGEKAFDPFSDEEV